MSFSRAEASTPRYITVSLKHKGEYGMKNIKVGFLGGGNMGGALAAAVAMSSLTPEILISDIDTEKAEALAKRVGGRAVTAEALAKESDFLFLGVKPQAMQLAVKPLVSVLRGRGDRPTLVTMAAGLSIKSIKEFTEALCPVIRIMPNTPVSVSKGMSPYAVCEAVSEHAVSSFTALMEKTGIVDPLKESLIDAACAVSGSGPAYVAMMAEALADGGVASGLPRDKALLYAAQTLLGTATLILEGEHPAILKDKVTSPGGTTIAGVGALEEGGFRAAVENAVKAGYKRAKELS